MAKKPCVICGKELGMLSSKAVISDGVVCSNCLARAGISALSNGQNYSTAALRDLLSRRSSIIQNYAPTKKVGTCLSVDEVHRSFKIGSDIFEYDNLLSFELLEDGQTIQKGGLGRAVAGGLLFGGVGAIVGGVTGGKKSKGICNSMRLRVTLKNSHTDTVYINFIMTETKTKGFIYQVAQTNAQSCISALEIIADQNKTTSAQTEQAAPSAADEIMKFKQLLDAGEITQEEFEAKKKQLLGI